MSSLNLLSQLNSMEQDVLIRKFQDTDAPQLLDLFRRTVREVNSSDYSLEQIAAWASSDISAAEWAIRFRGRCVVVAELMPDGHIDCFFVASDRQGEGIGGRLMEVVLREALALGIDQLNVDASITAVPFFTRHGFAVDAEQTVTLRGVIS